MAELDRREQLLAALDAAEEGTLEVPEEKNINEPETDPIMEEAAAEEQVEEEVSDEANEEPVEVSAESESEDANEAEEEEKPITRPSTWKKEYVQLWEKMEKGEQISKKDFVKFAEYANQRESEYKKGVSTYKAEADQAKSLISAIGPYIPTLQQRGIDAANYISSLAKADQILTNAPYEQKVQLFQKLAEGYGIQLNGNQAKPVDAYQQQLMNQLYRVNQEVSSIKSRYEQEEMQRLNAEIQKFSSDVEKYPHFESVREEMAQLLERGQAQDLKTAYTKAIRLNDEIWAKEQERLLSEARKKASKATQVAKAKAAAVSPKSVTPNGKLAETDGKKDRRALLSEQLGEAINTRV